MVANNAGRGIGAVTIYLIQAGAYGVFSRMIFTVIAIYYVTVVRVNPLQLVLIGTALEAAEFVCEVPTGILADTYSRRSAVVAGTFLFGFSYVCQGLLPLFAAIVALEVIRGVGNACISGALTAWVAHEVGERSVGQVLLRAVQVRQAGALAGIGFSVGLASIRLDLPILIGGGLGMASGLFLLIFMPERARDPSPVRGSRSWRTVRHTLRDAVRCIRERPVLGVLFAVAACYGASSEGIDRLWQAHLLANFTFHRLGALKPVVWFGIIEATSMLLGIAALQATRRRIDASNRTVMARALAVMTACQITCLAAFGLSPTFALALAAFWGYAAARSIAGPLYGTWLVQHIRQEVRATVLSIASDVDALGQIVGGPLIGTLATRVSLRASLVGVAALLLPVLPLFWHARRLDSAAPVSGVPGASPGDSPRAGRRNVP